MAGGIDDRQGEIIPLSSEVGLDREERLLDGVEIWGIRGKEHKLAHGLIFDQGPNVFRMMDATIVKHKHALRARVWIGKWNDQLTEELKESLRID